MSLSAGTSTGASDQFSVASRGLSGGGAATWSQMTPLHPYAESARPVCVYLGLCVVVLSQCVRACVRA